jgi:hypothetical protein
VRNASCIAIVCGLLLTVPGCGNSPKVGQPAPESQSFNDWRYVQSTMGLNPDKGFADFLQGLDAPERLKYINKCAEEGPPTRLYVLKSAFERFSKDTNADVAAAAKEALTKVPSDEEYEKLRKEDLEKMSGH